MEPTELHQFEIRLVKLETVIAEREAAQEERYASLDKRVEAIEGTLKHLLLLAVGQLLAIVVAGSFVAKVVGK